MTRDRRGRVATAVAYFILFNYAGFVLGATLAGGTAGVTGGSAGWRAAYAAPLVLAVIIMALARGFAPAPAAPARATPVPDAAES